MADFAMILIRCLAKSEQYLLNQYIQTPLDLFMEINKGQPFPIIPFEPIEK